jgi:cytoskeleton protein RodZ
VFEIGSSLRAAREHRKLGLADVERATRIRTKYLQALEDERWEVLPGTAYVKGFLRTYADFLGLDASQFVEEFNERFAPEEPFEPPALVRVRRRRRLLDVRLAVILLAVAIGLFSWRLATSGGGGGGKHTARRPVPPTTVHVRATTTTRTTPAPPRVAHVVLVATRGPCWLEVRSKGRLLYERELAQGERALFTGKRLWIRLGAPWNVDATVNGKPRRLPQMTGNIVVTAP